jgi:hypothetical protein
MLPSPTKHFSRGKHPNSWCGGTAVHVKVGSAQVWSGKQRGKQPPKSSPSLAAQTPPSGQAGRELTQPV